MKTIVTHFSPDIDAITACWLIKRYLPGWNQAKIEFVAAGSTLDKEQPDINPKIIHVDTGMGKFDHHQVNDYTSASLLVFNYLVKKNLVKDRSLAALKRMIDQINGFDHFSESSFPDPTNDRYEFMLHKIIEAGLKNKLKDDFLITETIFNLLDVVFNIFFKKILAEDEINQGIVFESKWGKCLAVSGKNEEVVKLGLKSGFNLVIKKDPDAGYIRIKTQPDKKFDLGPIYKKIIEKDKIGTWFLHVSHNMLLNSSSKNPHFIASKLSLEEVIEIIKEI
jgi:hypothetical protein